MSILADKKTKLLVQGITGREGEFHTKQMLAFGTKIVAGVTPGKGGNKVEGVPVFDTVEEAVKKTGANAACVFVPAAFSADAALESLYAGISLVVLITEGVPTQDMLVVHEAMQKQGAGGREQGAGKNKQATVVVGPNCPGLISPGKCKIGIIPNHIVKEGPVGIVSRSGTLTYEILAELTHRSIGQSTCVGIGGDPILGSKFIDILPYFEKDTQTKAVILIGEIGGSDEEIAAEYIKKKMKKPVVAFISGRTAPEGKRMGHAGAIISGGKGTAQSKMDAFKKARVPVADTLIEVADKIEALLKKKKKK